ncbi:hypothetical protein GW932_04385 [archaeon]|nr:hypothetical protein [archaeon]
MRKINLFFLIILILPFCLGITGKNVEENIGLSISVGTPTPIIEIISPKNGTYLTNLVELIFTSINAKEILFNVDNQNNLSIIGPVNFRLGNGNHTIYLYGINGEFISKKKISLEINPNLFEIHYENYSNYFETTNFYSFPFEEYTSFENITLKNENGKILFKEKINLIEDKNNSDGILEIDKNIKIGKTKLEINLDELPNFNKHAIIEFYNFDYQNPIIYLDEKICDEKICKIIFQDKNKLIFELNKIGNIELKEAEINTISSGGNSNILERNNEETNPFNLEEKQIILNTVQGRIIEKEIIIENKLNKEIKIELEQKGLEDILEIKNRTIFLAPSEKKSINLEFIARLNLLPNTYLGKINLITEDFTEEIWIVLNVEQENSLFDVEMKIIKDENTFYPGEEILVLTKLYNLGKTNRIDALNSYTIKDKEGNIILGSVETVAVETHLDSIKKLILPKNIEEGEYILSLRTEYNEKIALASETFLVKKNKEENIYYYIFSSILLIIIFSYLLKNKKIIKKKNLNL